MIDTFETTKNTYMSTHGIFQVIGGFIFFRDLDFFVASIWVVDPGHGWKKLERNFMIFPFKVMKYMMYHRENGGTWRIIPVCG